MKEMHKNNREPRVVRKRDRRAAKTKSPYTTYTTRRRRNRRNARVVLIVGALLALVVAVDYLANEGEILQAVRLGGTEESGETETDASDQEAVEEGGATGEGAVVEDPAPTILLGEYFTDSAWDPDPGRQSNLRMASQAIDETVLAPGEEFSALEVLGPLDYNPAKVFTDGGVAYEEGGGLCQISSTLYMAANYAGLEIVERNPHYAELNYIRPGFDATVWFGTNGWGALDMRFRNNTDGDILLREFINENGFLVAQIYGQQPADKVVSLDSQKVEEDLNKGIKWATYKTVMNSDGKVVENGLLFETTYSYNPPTPPELKHETYEPRGSGWVDTGNTTNWNDKNKPTD